MWLGERYDDFIPEREKEAVKVKLEDYWSLVAAAPRRSITVGRNRSKPSQNEIRNLMARGGEFCTRTGGAAGSTCKILILLSVECRDPTPFGSFNQGREPLLVTNAGNTDRGFLGQSELSTCIESERCYWVLGLVWSVTRGYISKSRIPILRNVECRDPTPTPFVLILLSVECRDPTPTPFVLILLSVECRDPTPFGSFTGQRE